VPAHGLVSGPELMAPDGRKRSEMQWNAMPRQLLATIDGSDAASGAAITWSSSSGAVCSVQYAVLGGEWHGPLFPCTED
jgi:hypothetical protein